MENTVEALTVPACSVLAWGTSLGERDRVSGSPRNVPGVSYWVPPKRTKSPCPVLPLDHNSKVQREDSTHSNKWDMLGQRRVLMIIFTEPLVCVRHFHISIALALTTLWSRHSCYPLFEVRVEIYIWITDIFYFTDQVEIANILSIGLYSFM